MTHDKAIGKRQEWIGKSGDGLLGVWAIFEGAKVSKRDPKVLWGWVVLEKKHNPPEAGCVMLVNET
jgi:hypothetical protein